jgi:MoxR-like ATPase
MTQADETQTRVRRLARTFATRLDQLKNDYVGRDEAIAVIGLATLCREHVLLVGPPGTAKTALLTSFGRLFDTAPFTYLLTRFTEPTELFGPVDVKLFQERSLYRVNTEGMLPRAHLAFLDEVFEGSSAILNALLTLINERTFHNGSVPEPSNLVTLLGSSNEVPDDPVLAAFSDRFLLRCQLEYVADDDVEDVLDVGWRTERTAIDADAAGNGHVISADRMRARFPLGDLAILQRAVAGVDLSAVRDTYAEIVRELRGQGVAFSDRRAVKAQKTFAATALLAGRRVAELADLAPLVYLWTDRRDEPAIRRVLGAHGVAVEDRVHRLRDQAEIRLDLMDLRGRGQAASKEENRELIRRLDRLDKELRRDHPQATELLAEVKRTQRDAILAFAERFEEDAMDGVGNV